MILTKGSLCTGVGGLDSALPGELAWLAETDDSCTRLLKREHPDVPNLGDITTEDFTPGHVDLLTSGDPCQSLSVAGAKRATGDERFLWPYVIGAIDRARPRQIFLENVQNVTSVALVKGADDWRGQKGSVLAQRLSDLRTAGYACRWTVLGACAVGGCHHRHRWFLRGRHVGQGAPEAERLLVKCGAPRNGGRILLPSPTTADGSGGPGTSPSRTGGMNLRTAVQLLPTPSACSYGSNQGGAAGRVGPVRYSLDSMARLEMLERWGKYASAIQLWAETFGHLPPEPTEPAPKGGRRLNAALSEWMMGHRPGFLTDEFSRNDALRMAGNGAMAIQARAAWDLLERGEEEA